MGGLKNSFVEINELKFPINFQTYLLNCLSCERCYHMMCLTPPAEKKPKAPWKFSYCLQNHNKKSGVAESSNKSLILKSPGSNYHLDARERKKQMKKQR